MSQFRSRSYLKAGLIHLMLWWSAVAMFATPPALVPLPQQMQTQPGTFTLCPAQPVPGAPTPAPTRILVDDMMRETGEYLAALLFKSTGFRFEIATNPGASPVTNAILLTPTAPMQVSVPKAMSSSCRRIQS